MPSPDPGRPGLVIRDPYQFSDSILVVPTPLVPLLDCFDGDHSELDLRSEIVRITGRIQVGEIEQNLFDSLDEAGFLENENYQRLRRNREAGSLKSTAVARRCLDQIGVSFGAGRTLVTDDSPHRFGAGPCFHCRNRRSACESGRRMEHVPGRLSGAAPC